MIMIIKLIEKVSCTFFFLTALNLKIFNNLHLLICFCGSKQFLYVGI